MIVVCVHVFIHMPIANISQMSTIVTIKNS